jgi:hypothetical protein
MPAKKSVSETPTKKFNVLEKIKNLKKISKPKEGDRSSLWAKIGFTLGLVGIGSWLIPILGLAVTTTALVFNILGLKAVKGRWFAVAGLTLAIVFLNLTFIYGFYNVLLSMFNGGV